MKTKYPLSPKPKLEEGKFVQITLDGTEEKICEGYIRGIGMSHLLDHYIIKLTKQSQKIVKNNYPFSCILIQHTLIYQS